MSHRRLLLGCTITTLMVVLTAGQSRARDLGVAQPLSSSALRNEMVASETLAAYVVRHGRPDWAEVQRVTAEPPLAPYEVRLFYLDEGIAVSFTEARLAGGIEVSLKRWEHPLDEPKRVFIMRELMAVNPALRAEAAAKRAEAAAERIEVAADAAEAAAETAVNLVAEMEAGPGAGPSWQ